MARELSDLREIFFSMETEEERAWLQGHYDAGTNLVSVLDRETAPVLDEYTLAGDNRYYHPMPQNVTPFRTFIAPASGSVAILVEIHGNNPGLAFANFGVVVGIPVAGRLRGAGQYAPIVPGAVRKKVGRATIDGIVDISTVLDFDGLDPGTVYTYVLEVAIVGGYNSLAIATPTAIIPNLAQTKAYVFSGDAALSAITPVTLGGRPHWSVMDGRATPLALATIAHPAGPYGLYRADITPDGTKIVASATASTGVLVLNTATEAVAKIGNPATGTAPYPVVCRTNTEAIVGFTGTGRICALDITNPAVPVWGAPITPGRTIISLACNTDGSVLWAGGSDGLILRYDMPGFANATFLDIGGRIEDIVYTADKLWVALPNELRSIHPTTFATIDTVALPSTPNKIDISADGKVVWVVLQNGIVRYYSTALFTELPNMNEHDNIDLGAAGTSLTLTSDEHIYVSVDNTLNVWPGSVAGILVDSGDGPGGIGEEFLDHGCSIKVVSN